MEEWIVPTHSVNDLSKVEGGIDDENAPNRIK